MEEGANDQGSGGGNGPGSIDGEEALGGDALARIEAKLNTLFVMMRQVLQSQCAVFTLNQMQEVGENITGVKSPIQISRIQGPVLAPGVKPS